ncbi:MAG: lysozyme [Drouetiella hepatica Uher 2000/2452]|uniref:Lysozyme n=1 Tax=Drouetiella hepatica Uher 2000/2452 TaxID=904376 RepID=A0A951UPK8_9CYAN|nr:lysozyme [Drouetiella hepatica Uher 2000/2452]
MLKDGKPFSAADVPRSGAIGAAGLELIKSFEGCVLDAYQDVVGVWTIGYGSTGAHVYPGQSITQEQAEALLKKDLERFEAAIGWMVTAPINGNQRDSLISFAFNLGEGALQGSTLLWRLNQGDYAGAADQFPRWANAGGEQLAGLVRRRKAERSLFLSQNYTQYL